MKKELMIKTLFELIKNSKRSDREIARSLSLWQSTITRYRKTLEKEGMIREYTIIPNLKKMGYQVLVFLFVKRPTRPRKAIISPEVWNKKMKEWVNDSPEVIFSIGVTVEWDAVIVSLHRSIKSLDEYFKSFRKISEDFIADSKHFMAFLDGKDVLKPFSFRHLEKGYIFDDD